MFEACIGNICLDMLGKYIPNVYAMKANIDISPFCSTHLNM